MRLHQEQSLPLAVLQGCRALVLLSSVKVGAGWSCSFGTGQCAQGPGSTGSGGTQGRGERAWLQRCIGFRLRAVAA